MYSFDDIERYKRGVIDAIVVLWEDLRLIGYSDAANLVMTGKATSDWSDIARAFEDRDDISDFQAREYNTILQLIALYTIFSSFPDDPFVHSLNENLPKGLDGSLAEFVSGDNGRKRVVKEKDLTDESLRNAKMGVKILERFRADRAKAKKGSDTPTAGGGAEPAAPKVAADTDEHRGSVSGPEAGTEARREPAPTVVEHVTVEFDPKNTDEILGKRTEMFKNGRISAAEFYDDMSRMPDRSVLSFLLEDDMEMEGSDAESKGKHVRGVNGDLLDKVQTVMTNRASAKGVRFKNKGGLIPYNYLINMLLFQYLGEPDNVKMSGVSELVGMLVRVEEQRLSGVEQALVAMKIDIENLIDKHDAHADLTKTMGREIESTKRLSAFHLGERMGLGDRPRKISDIDPYNDGIESLVEHVDGVVQTEERKKYEREHRM